MDQPLENLPNVKTCFFPYANIIDALESLGLKGITPSQNETTTEQCFPYGTENVTEDEVITEVFRYLKSRTWQVLRAEYLNRSVWEIGDWPKEIMKSTEIIEELDRNH